MYITIFKWKFVCSCTNSEQINTSLSLTLRYADLKVILYKVFILVVIMFQLCVISYRDVHTYTLIIYEYFRLQIVRAMHTIASIFLTGEF